MVLGSVQETSARRILMDHEGKPEVSTSELDTMKSAARRKMLARMSCEHFGIKQAKEEELDKSACDHAIGRTNSRSVKDVKTAWDVRLLLIPELKKKLVPLAEVAPLPRAPASPLAPG